MKDYALIDCKRCSNEFQPKRKNQCFCSKKCRTNYTCLKHYHTHKNEKSFLQKRIDYKNKYRKTNPNYRIKKIEWNGRYKHKLYAQRLPLGLCVECGKERENKLKKRCDKCRIYHALKTKESLSRSQTAENYNRGGADQLKKYVESQGK